MKFLRATFSLFISIIFLGIGCQSNVGGNYGHDDYYSEDGFENGTYCAEVDYYNPNTGTRSTYTLEVEVENDEMVKIYWGNGGWLDEDHFTAEELDEDGYCSFTSDKGYEYEVQITGRDCNSTDEYSFQNDVEEDEEAVTCPECGDEKDEYDEYCYSCKRKLTCPKCGDKKNRYDDYCNSCKRRIEDEEQNTCSSCGAYELGVYGGLCSNCQDDEEDRHD